MNECIICGNETEQELCEQCRKDPRIVLLLLWYLIVNAEHVSAEIHRVSTAWQEMLDILMGKEP